MDDSDKDRSFLQRLRHFVALLLRTKEMDQFLRSLKTQFNNTAQALYDSFLDILFEKSQSSQPAAAAIAGADAAASNQIIQKKDVFKHLGTMEECRNALVIQMLVYA